MIFFAENGHFTFGNAWSSRAFSSTIGKESGNGSDEYDNIIESLLNKHNLLSHLDGFKTWKDSIVAYAKKGEKESIMEILNQESMGLPDEIVKKGIVAVLVDKYQTTQEVPKGMLV